MSFYEVQRGRKHEDENVVVALALLMKQIGGRLQKWKLVLQCLLLMS